MTPEAFARDVSYDLRHIGDWNRFPRMAMITDKVWLATLVRGTAALFPFIEARVWEPGEQADALAWVSALPAEPV